MAQKVLLSWHKRCSYHGTKSVVVMALLLGSNTSTTTKTTTTTINNLTPEGR